MQEHSTVILVYVLRGTSPTPAPHQPFTGRRKQAQSKLSFLLLAFQTNASGSSCGGSCASKKMLLFTQLVLLISAVQRGWLKIPLCWDAHHLPWKSLLTRLD